MSSPLPRPTAWASAPGAPRIGSTGPAFTQVEQLHRHAPPHWLPASALQPETLAPFIAPRPPLAGLSLDRPRVMGIVNVTPDSFSDGGARFDPGRAVADGLAMVAAGADLVDVGGESTRPGAEPVAIEEEIRRIVPVVRALAGQGVLVSIDTRRAPVMAAALEAGAQIINDVSALTDSPASLAIAAASTAPIVLMHMQGAPRTMQNQPHYDDVVFDVYAYLAQRIAACEAAGIERARLVVDPGIGFGKTTAHNVRLLACTSVFHGLGCPVLIGVSRKRFIGALSRNEGPQQRLGGSLAVALDSLYQGAQILRVHDVAETVQAVALWRALNAPTP